MSENVVLGLPCQNYLAQVNRSRTLFCAVEVQDIKGRTVGHQKVYFLGNMVPYHFFPLEIVLKGVTNIVGTVGRPKDSHSLNLHHLMFQVDAPLFQLWDYLILAELCRGSNTEQGYLARYWALRWGEMQPLSRTISWLPDMTILYRKFNFSRYLKKAWKSFSLP